MTRRNAYPDVLQEHDKIAPGTKVANTDATLRGLHLLVGMSVDQTVAGLIVGTIVGACIPKGASWVRRMSDLLGGRAYKMGKRGRCLCFKA